jgi:hypothetical protein
MASTATAATNDFSSMLLIINPFCGFNELLLVRKSGSYPVRSTGILELGSTFANAFGRSAG